jgi:hypothetical protein
VVVVPLVGNAPLQPPEAVQALAFEAFHCSVTDVPIATLLSLAFKVTDGGVATAGVSAPVDGCVCVSAVELAPQAASEPRASNPSIDFNANAIPLRRLRRIELITRLPIFPMATFRRSLIPFVRNLRDHIFIRIFESANLSPFAN